MYLGQRLSLHYHCYHHCYTEVHGGYTAIFIINSVSLLDYDSKLLLDHFGPLTGVPGRLGLLMLSNSSCCEALGEGATLTGVGGWEWPS